MHAQVLMSTKRKQEKADSWEGEETAHLGISQNSRRHNAFYMKWFFDFSIYAEKTKWCYKCTLCCILCRVILSLPGSQHLSYWSLLPLIKFDKFLYWKISRAVAVCVSCNCTDARLPLWLLLLITLTRWWFILQDDEGSISFHGVAFLNLAPLLYPGGNIQISASQFVLINLPCWLSSVHVGDSFCVWGMVH